MVRLSRERPAIEVVAAYGRDPARIGKDVGELCGGPPSGVLVSDRPSALAIEADLVLIATTPFIRDVEPEIHEGIRSGLDVVCTAEELASPWGLDPDAARRIDEAAKSSAVTVLGAGANPGYIYEVVGLALTGAMWRVDRIRVTRVVDLSGFGAVVLRRLGVGYEPEAFAAGVRGRSVFGHIGFAHTMRTFARRLGVSIDGIEETIDPIVASTQIEAAAVGVSPGQSAGLHQLTIASVGRSPWFTAEFIGHVDLPAIGLAPRDAYEIDGAPPIKAVVEPGFNPQWTTAGVLANLFPLVVAARPGLLSVTDLPIPSPWS